MAHLIFLSLPFPSPPPLPPFTHPPLQDGDASSALVSIRDYHSLEQAKGSYTVFNIYVRGEYCTSRRYSELANFYKRLKARFPWNKFPPFPGKKMNGLMSSTLGVRAHVMMAGCIEA